MKVCKNNYSKDHPVETRCIIPYITRPIIREAEKKVTGDSHLYEVNDLGTLDH